MVNEDRNKIQIIVFPYHGQGHMNTMLQFSKRLVWKAQRSSGVQITITTTFSTIAKMKSKIEATWDKSITLHSIYDDTNEGKIPWKDRMSRFEASAMKNLTNILLLKKQESGNKCLLVYDGFLNWALEITQQHGIRAAAFFPQSCSTVATYYCLYLETQGKELPSLPAALPGLDLIQRDVPSNLGIKFANIVEATNGKEYSPFVLYMLRQCTNLDRADMLLFNQFDELVQQGEVLEWISKRFNVKTIGPTLPSVHIDKRIENDTTYGFNQWSLENDACLKWLDHQPPRSVVYIAFGSGVLWSNEQMSEIAEALKHYPCSFLWAVRETEQQKIPTNFITEMSDKGLVLSWCPQLDVLKHDSVACFMTHCGWNSIIEALSFGVPMLSMPQYLDQPVDAHFVENVWGAGVTVERNKDGLISRQEIIRCLEEIMHGERAEKIKENTAKWKLLAKEALDEGGSTDTHLDEIIEWVSSF